MRTRAVGRAKAGDGPESPEVPETVPVADQTGKEADARLRAEWRSWYLRELRHGPDDVTIAEENLRWAAGLGEWANAERCSDEDMIKEMNAKTKDGQTVLHVAASSGLNQICKWLVRGGAHMNVKDSSGATPLMRACSRGHGGVVLFLLQEGCDARCRSRLTKMSA